MVHKIEKCVVCNRAEHSRFTLYWECSHIECPLRKSLTAYYNEWEEKPHSPFHDEPSPTINKENPDEHA